MHTKSSLKTYESDGLMHKARSEPQLGLTNVATTVVIIIVF
jgi:hypothetical protein